MTALAWECLALIPEGRKKHALPGSHTLSSRLFLCGLPDYQCSRSTDWNRDSRAPHHLTSSHPSLTRLLVLLFLLLLLPLRLSMVKQKSMGPAAARAGCMLPAYIVAVSSMPKPEYYAEYQCIMPAASARCKVRNEALGRCSVLPSL